MTIYIFNLFLLIVSTCLIYFSFNNTHTRSVVLSVVLTGQLFLLSVLRNSSVGADLKTYIEVFHYVNETDWKELTNIQDYVWWVKMEYGYLVFNKLLSYISVNERFLVLTTSCFILIGFAKYIYKNSKIIWLSFFLLITLGYYTQSFNIMRQYIALVIVLNSLKYIEDRQCWKFLFSVCIAFFFHKTALFILPLYPLSKMEIGWKYILFVFSGAFLFSVLWSYILGILASYGGFASYLEDDGDGGGLNMLILLNIVTWTGFLLQEKKVREKPAMKIYYHIMIISTALQMLGLQFPMFGRLLLYYSINLIIFIPNVLASLKSKNLKVFGTLFVCLLTCIYLFFIVFAKDSSSVVPYLFVWE